METSSHRFTRNSFPNPGLVGTGFRVCVRTHRLQIESRRACPELVERGRLNFKLVQIRLETEAADYIS